MAVNEVVSGVGANAKRTDKNVSSRVAKIQRDAKVQEASGGQYGNRAELTSIAQGAPMNVPSPSMSMPAGALPPVAAPINAFAPGSGAERPLSDGSPLGPGRGTEALPIPVTTPNPDSIFIRALAKANPDSRQLMMMVEAYNEMEA
jgi:hypothetical protein